MKAKVEASRVNLLKREKVEALSTNPKNGQPVDDGNWKYRDTYTAHKKGEVVDVDEITFRNLSKKGSLVAA